MTAWSLVVVWPAAQISRRPFMPFILRGVKLIGIDSVMAPQPRRQRAWDRLAELLDIRQMLDVYKVIGLDEVPAAGEDMLLGRIKGRVVVDVNK